MKAIELAITTEKLKELKEKGIIISAEEEADWYKQKSEYLEKFVIKSYSEAGVLNYLNVDMRPHYINDAVQLVYNQNKEMGWHDKPREFGTMIALIHSELSEALEGDRKDLKDDHLPHREMAEVELADAVIRIFDLAGKMGYDLGGAIYEKIEYNAKRADHKKENREKEGGKKY